MNILKSQGYTTTNQTKEMTIDLKKFSNIINSIHNSKTIKNDFSSSESGLSEYHDSMVLEEKDINEEVYNLYWKAMEMEMDEEKLDCLSSETLV